MGHPQLWRKTTATTKNINRYVFIAVVVVCCGEVGMRGETAWLLDAGQVRDFQIRTVRMWSAGEPVDRAAGGSQISNGVHRQGRAMRNASLVDGWKYGHGP